MNPAPDLRRELGDWRLWTVRAVVVLLAAAAGLTVVGFTWLAEAAYGRFMVAFLAAATQAPLTALIIAMEMVDGHAMVLSLMACALVAFAVARLNRPPLYPTLARLQPGRMPAPERPHPAD